MQWERKSNQNMLGQSSAVVGVRRIINQLNTTIMIDKQIVICIFGLDTTWSLCEDPLRSSYSYSDQISYQSHYQSSQ